MRTIFKERALLVCVVRDRPLLLLVYCRSLREYEYYLGIGKKRNPARRDL